MTGRLDWSYFLTLLREAIDGLVWAWPVTAALLVGVVALVCQAARQRPRLPLLPMVWQIALLGVPLLTLALGVRYRCENCSPGALGQGVRHRAAMHVADALFVAQVAWAIWFVYASARRRLLAAFVQALLLWCTFWAGLMAGMSMSGDWL